MSKTAQIALLVWLSCMLGLLIGTSFLIRDTRQRVEDLRASFRVLGSAIDDLEGAATELREAATQ